MAAFKRPRNPDIEARQFEEKVYEAVAKELESGVRREGLWLKAIADAEGDEAKAKARYIRYRAQAMLDEAQAAADRAAQEAPSPAEVDALYGQYPEPSSAKRGDGRITCLNCKAINAIDLGRYNPRCGSCGVHL